MGKILELIEYKEKMARKIEEMLSNDSILKAKRDPHSKRKPRPCGITIHTGIGCSYVCSYCYIFDMGFPAKVSPYPLTSTELVYALLNNPYVVPYRTFAAFGSVTEPFLAETRGKTIDYMASIYKWLHLPSQISTKAFIDNELAKKLKEVEPNVSILVTLVTILKSSELEPLAPKPLDRLNGVSIASRHGLNVYLFIRPIIPGITDKEIDMIARLGVEHGAKGIVLGSLRITRSILSRLKGKGADIEEILRRAPATPKGREQIPIKVNDIVIKAEKIAQDYGLKVFRSACMANIDSHNDYCYMCDLGPCGNIKRGHYIDYNDVIEYLDYVGLKTSMVEISPKSIDITVSDVKKDKIELIKVVLRYASRKNVNIRCS